MTPAYEVREVPLGTPLSPPRSGEAPAAARRPRWTGWDADGRTTRKQEQVHLATRLVLHLASLGPPSADRDARAESTQRGIAERLGATQGAVSKVLRRLSAAGVIVRERRHVRGWRRQVRAYYLTARGEELAREIAPRISSDPSRARVLVASPV